MDCHNTIFLFVLFFSLSPLFTSGTKNPVHIHFYMQSIPGKTAIVVAKSETVVSGSFYNFGSIVVIDNQLTEGPDIASNPVGIGQGTMSVMNSMTVAWVANIVFTNGPYSGSSLAFLGADNITQPVRELSIVGGNGVFRMAQGYLLLKTYSVNYTIGGATLEVDIYAYLPKLVGLGLGP